MPPAFHRQPSEIRRKAVDRRYDQAVAVDLWTPFLYSPGFTCGRPFITFQQLFIHRCKKGSVSLLPSAWGSLWHHWLQPSVNGGWEQMGKCPASNTPVEESETGQVHSFPESSEGLGSSGNHILTYTYWLFSLLCLILHMVSFVFLGITSQINNLHPHICLSIFLGTQTKIAIYCGQQMPSMCASFPVPVLLTHLHVASSLWIWKHLLLWELTGIGRWNENHFPFQP